MSKEKTLPKERQKICKVCGKETFCGKICKDCIKYINAKKKEGNNNGG